MCSVQCGAVFSAASLVTAKRFTEKHRAAFTEIHYRLANNMLVIALALNVFFCAVSLIVNNTLRKV